MGISVVVLGAFGVICILYGFAIMAVGSGTWFFSFWFVLGVVLLTAAWAVHAGLWSALSPIVRKIIIGGMAVLAVGFAVVLGVIAQNFGDEGEPGLDYIIVLGAQVREDGPSGVLQFRLDAAYDYLVENEKTRCIVSGGQGFNEHTAEANVMADYLIARGIDPNRIIKEDRATNTRENIEYSMTFINPTSDRVGIVTNNFHAFRGVHIARKAGIAHVCGIAAGSMPLYFPNNVVRETMSVAKDLVLGNI